MLTIEKLPNYLSSNIRLRFLRDEEKSFTTGEKELPLVIEPVQEKSFSALAELVRENRDWFHRQQDNCGALLFRGFEIETAAQFENILELQQLWRGETLTMRPPFVVKPTSEDNSLGVTLVWDESQIEAALDKGFELEDKLLVEDYIPGRELRVAVVERKGELQVLPMIEYLVTEEHPIRTVNDKLVLQSDGTPEKQPEKPIAKPICPANVTPELFEKLANAAKSAHIALGCRDYSLYDFRVHTNTNEPYFLEAGLFWTFGKIAMISRMLQADGESLEDVALELWSAAAGRTRVACGSLFKWN